MGRDPGCRASHDRADSGLRQAAEEPQVDPSTRHPHRRHSQDARHPALRASSNPLVVFGPADPTPPSCASHAWLGPRRGRSPPDPAPPPCAAPSSSRIICRHSGGVLPGSGLAAERPPYTGVVGSAADGDVWVRPHEALLCSTVWAPRPTGGAGTQTAATGCGWLPLALALLLTWVLVPAASRRCCTLVASGGTAGPVLDGPCWTEAAWEA